MRDLRSHSRLCDRAREYSSRGLDGELSEFERALLENHLERCEPCRAYSVELEQIVGRLRLAPLEALPHPISLPSRRRVRGRVLQVAAAGAAAVVAVTAGLVGGIQSHHPAAPRANLSLPTIVNSEDFHSLDVQELHQIRAYGRIPEANFVQAHGRGQKDT
jgi:ferric-dicitrate binding protein FerR (iron transport regulator)